MGRPHWSAITVRAEQAGFNFAAISDHFSPWLDEQGHSPFTWSVLGAAANATSRIGLMTAVTCPIMRYHPAIVSQAAATVAISVTTASRWHRSLPPPSLPLSPRPAP